MVDNRSYKIWLVLEAGWEHSTPLLAYTKRSTAMQQAERLQRTKPVSEHGEPLTYKCMMLDLVTHDGAAVLHEAIVASLKNGGHRT